MRTSNNKLKIQQSSTRRRVRPRRKASRSVPPTKDQNAQRRVSQSEMSDSASSMEDTNNRFSALAPTEPAPGVVRRYHPSHMQPDFTFRIEKRTAKARRSRSSLKRAGSSGTESQESVARRSTSNLHPENASSQQIHLRSQADQTNLSVSCRLGLALSKTSSQSSLSEASPLTLEETKNSPHLSKPKRSFSSSSIEPLEEPAALSPHADSGTLHPALPSPTSMTTDSPFKSRVFLVPKVLLPPTSALTQASSPENARRSTVASLALAAESSRGKIIPVMLKNSVPTMENSQLKREQMGGERMAAEVVHRPGGEESIGDDVGGKEGRDEEDGDQGGGENFEAERGLDDAEDWEWIG